ncbi:ubiquitin conjugating enzyme family protein [Thelephora terrestris]|uniref:Ubiquitin conjugating enzyme family protein n=1 Tax=Thelephora terrestris TaxID=56493 RepID=A0A9P6H6Z1_9AGAM|nr:ubiquitin conjugating enzyme family protein [Thelephora terrestris]
MDSDVAQLVEMGATVAQARAALKRYPDVMEAASQIFEGKFAHIVDEDEDASMDDATADTSGSKRKATNITPDDSDDDVAEGDGDDGDFDDYDYDSGPEMDIHADGHAGAADPYAGIFFSKDRREEVIEVEEDPEVIVIPGQDGPVKLMTQSQWMKGCPEGGEQGFLFSLYNELSHDPCQCPSKCGYSVARTKGDFFPVLGDFFAYVRRLKGLVRKLCPRCNKQFCLACGETIAEGQSKDEDILFHCPNLQGVLLGVGLFMLENKYTEQFSPAVLDDISQSKSRNIKRRKTGTGNSSPASEVDEYDYGISGPAGKKAKGGTGYAGSQKEDTTGQEQAAKAQKVADERIAKLMKAIRDYLPSISRGRTSDYLVHPTTLAHLRRRFNYTCSSLLRNDSLADMSDRSVLYFELFEWLQTISRHEALASMMGMPIMVLVSSKPVAKKPAGFKGASKTRERTLTYEGSSGPRELLESIFIQAQAALKGLEASITPETAVVEATEEEKRMTSEDKGKAKAADPAAMSPENAQLLSFCRSIQGTVQAIDRALEEAKGKPFMGRLRASLPSIPNSSTGHEYVATPETEAETQKAYVDWATKVRFEYCDLSIPPSDQEGKDAQVHYKFHYDAEARIMANQDIPKRSLAIAKELAVLTTNLPIAWNSSIFLRVDETRVDVIKALIIGPEGTPYENGCFLFDIFLPAGYNHSPPHVKYMTTHGGKYRFNPNLYAEGKVCLSLLGTWSGPGWVSGKSTLLQVLISIQSMILCEEPYLNEPAWAQSGGTPPSKAYSANVRRMVIRTAMLGNLRNPPEPWENVIRTHFRLKARSIAKQLNHWLQLDDGRQISEDGANIENRSPAAGGGGSSNGMKKDVDALVELMNSL